MDEMTHQILAKLDLEKANLISINDFEDASLKVVKPSRSVAEYCWTCTPSLPLYVFSSIADIDLVTYVDADVFFFGDPDAIFGEFGNNSILIIEHRFPPHLEYLEVNGKYNVQFVSFRRDSNALRCLKWWRERCLEWCYNRLEEGKMGDQKYLDDWTARFEGVHVLKNVGAGVAPWNVSQYDVHERDGGLWVDQWPLIFYHFHQFRIMSNGKYFWASNLYRTRKELPSSIYRRYIDEIENARAMVQAVAPGFAFGIEKAGGIWLTEFARRYVPRSVKKWLRGLAF